MNATAIIWTAVVIVAVLIDIGIIVAVSRNAAAKKREHQREEAARIHQDTAESEHQLHAREADAQQPRAEAKQADADAAVQAAEAKRRQAGAERLDADAAERDRVARAERDEHERRPRHADVLDPDTEENVPEGGGMDPRADR